MKEILIMEPIKELEDCVDMIFNNTKTLTESAEDIIPNTSDASFDAAEPEEDDHMSDLSDTGSEFEEGDQVVVVDPENEQLNGTKWIYDGPSDKSPDMAEVHSETDDTNMAIDYSKIQKASLDVNTDTTEPKPEPTATTNNSALDSLKMNDPENPKKKLGESKSIEDAVLSVLESVQNINNNNQSESIDNKTILECGDTEKTKCPNCGSEPCKCEPAPKKRKFVTKKVEESFEEAKARKLAEAKEKGFSI